MYGFEIITKPEEKTAKQINTVVLILGAYVAACAFWSGFLSVFPIKVTPEIVYALQFVTVLLWGLVCRPGRGKKAAGALAIAGCVLAAVFKRTSLILGINHFANQYITLLNKFNSTNAPLYEDTDGEGPWLVLFLMEMVIALIFVLVLQAKKGAVLAVLLLALPFILAALVGEMPSTVSGWGIIGAGIVYFIIFRSRDSKKVRLEIITAAIAFAGAVLVATSVQPVILKVRDKNEQKYIKIHNMLVDAQQDARANSVPALFGGDRNYATGGIGKGDLRNLAENRPKGTTDMVVICDRYPGESVYLKAFVGSEYTGKKWEEPSKKDLRNALKKAGVTPDENALFGEPFERIKKGQNELNARNIDIRLENASGAFAYSPYYVQVDKKASVYADAYIQGKGGGSREYNYYQRGEAEGIGERELAKESKAWNAYRDYVSRTYTAFPENLEKIKDYCLEFRGTIADTVAFEIDKKFRSDLKYSLKPGQYPGGQDFAEYFLTESKKGFCVHFATAAALIYRERGCPSRYVEGYAVPPEAFEEQEDGTWKAVVTDEMAHAWCETFDKDLGWQVREHTYSAGINSEDYTASDTTDKEPDDRPETEPQQVEEQEKEPEEQPEKQTSVENNKEKDGTEGSDKGNENGSTSGKWNTVKTAGKVIITVAGSLAVLVLLLILWRNIRRQRRKHSFRLKVQNKGISNIYRAVCDIAVFAGLVYNEDDEYQTLEQMKKQFTQLEEAEWEWMYECAQKAAFAKGQVDKKDQQKMYRLYVKFRENILNGLGKGKKFIFLYWKGL